MEYPLHPQGTLVDTLYKIIKKEIAASYLQPGDRLNSRVLAERYQVSETPIKQALNRLVTEGLVESIPRKGMRVRKITQSEIEEILELRMMLDSYFVSDIITNLRLYPELAEQLLEIIRQQESCLNMAEDADYYTKTYELDNRFHELYISSSGNSKALEMFHNMNSLIYSGVLYGHQPKDQVREGIREHQELLDALMMGDAKRSRESIRIHIRHAKLYRGI